VDTHARGTDAVRENLKGGVFGGPSGTPVVDLHQASVPGIYTIKCKPVVVNGQIVVRPNTVVVYAAIG
jgi:pyruvate/2-oxoglutarate dehydrogenase complex dihydrolipoamide acyltransferase (E2) component